MLKEASSLEAPRAGNGRVSGVVRVPEAATITSSGGTRALYVYLLQEKSGGKGFFFPVPMLYVIVFPQNVALGKATYSIRNVPAGRYKVVAEWDVADPMVQEQTVSEKRILNYLGSRGDYQGEYPQVVDVSDNADIVDVSFDCMTLARNGVSSFQIEPQAFFEIRDIYFYRPTPDTYKFILVIENLRDDVLQPLSLGLIVNGTRSIFPLEIGQVGPHQEKQFDITEFVDHVRSMKEWDQGATPDGPRALIFKIVAPWNQELLFEKTISVL
jgi:hypothetical protein